MTASRSLVAIAVALAAIARGDWPALFFDHASGLQPETDPTSDLFCLWDAVALLNQPKTSRKVIVDRKRKQLPNAW